jgi:fermentation-respiration switch protein FrsA (DUF1100 family)
MRTYRRILRRLSLAALRISLMLAIGLAIYFRLFEGRLIFYPTATHAGIPNVPFEDVQFKAADGTRLHGWLIPSNDRSRIFIISHGNAGNIGDRYELGEYVNQEFRASVLMYDYRGYGKSEGKPSEAGLYSDLEGALTYSKSRGYPRNQTYLIGQSLGTAVTVELASREPVAGVILEAPFTSIRAVARHYMFSIPFDYVLKSRFDSLAKVLKLSAPVAVVHGRRDKVIPFDLGMQLFDAIPGTKKFFPVEAEIHEGALMALGSERTKELREFLFRNR